MAELSPAAQAVINATGPSFARLFGETGWRVISAALRALADEVAPDEPDYMRAAIHDQGWWDKQDLIRSEILAIAAELEA